METASVHREEPIKCFRAWNESKIMGYRLTEIQEHTNTEIWDTQTHRDT